jgi:hypothetical protein
VITSSGPPGFGGRPFFAFAGFLPIFVSRLLTGLSLIVRHQKRAKGKAGTDPKALTINPEPVETPMMATLLIPHLRPRPTPREGRLFGLRRLLRRMLQTAIQG